MLRAHDHTATDTLHNFHHALQRAQQTLQQEETRLAQLTHTVRQQQEHTNAMRDGIRGQQQQLEALRREIARVRSIAAKHTCEVEEQERHLAAVRRPREEAEAESRTHTQTHHEQQRRYLAQSTAIHAQLAQWLQPQNSLASLQATVTQREVEVAELQRVVGALQQQLEEANAAQTVRASPHGAASDEGMEGMEKEDGPSTMRLEQQLQQQQEERETFERECGDVLSARRGELERLKVELKRLCAEVEAVDAAQQAAQQEFNAALNQQSEARVVCGVCGKDIIDFFTL